MKYTEIEFFPGDTVRITKKTSPGHVEEMTKYIGETGVVASVGYFEGEKHPLIMVEHEEDVAYVWSGDSLELVESVERVTEETDGFMVCSMEGFLEHVHRYAVKIVESTLLDAVVGMGETKDEVLH